MENALLIVALILPWILLAVLSWLLYQLLQHNGRLLLAMEDLTSRLGEAGLAGEPALPPALPIGFPAPEFALPDLDGAERSLHDFLGKPVVLTFFDLRCGFCQQMAPELGELRAGAARVVLVSRGDPEEHRRWADEHGWRCDVVLDQERDVARAYQFVGTPTAYLLDAEGHIASELAIGPRAVLALTTATPATSDGGGNGAARARATALRVRDITDSRINRDGLPAGTPAPDFSLPDLDGDERSLSDFRDRRVLLVFSDVECAPCDSLAPKLVELHEKGVEIVMVSRGTPGANREKAKRLGYRFPVLLQRSWEISKRYGMFATPVAYAIDERGVIARDVAVGEEEILGLV
jgi:peroxiredoxin